MTSRDHLRAAARCWERAGFCEEAAERFAVSKAWHDAGRCFSAAERYRDAAHAYSRAHELLPAARQHLMGLWPEQAWPLYERLLRSKPFIFPAAQVEVLLGLGQLDQAASVTIASGNRDAVAFFAGLASARGRPDLGSTFWSQVDETSWESFAPFSRSRCIKRPPPAAGADKTWPLVEFTEATLKQIWEASTERHWWGHNILDWSTDGTFFAAAVNEGFLRGRIGPGSVEFKRWRIRAGSPHFVRFLPQSHAVLIDRDSGLDLSFVAEDGSEQRLAVLRPPSSYNTVKDISFTPQGDRVAVSARGHWNEALLKVRTWQGVHVETHLKGPKKQTPFASYPVSAWSPDGHDLAWSPGPYDSINQLFLFGLQDEHEVVEAHRNTITSLAFTTNGRFLISASFDQTVIVRDGRNGEGIALSEHFEDRVYGAPVHPHAALIAVGEGNRLHLLRLHASESPRLSRLSEQTLDEDIKSLAFSPDGRHLLVMTQSHLHLFRVDLKP